MKLPLVIAAILAALPGSAAAQTPAKPQPAAKQAPAQIKPKPVTTVPVRPAVQTPVDTAKAMEQAERLAIQSDLAWVSLYNGAINGEASDRMVAAIKAFQKDHGAKETGVLNAQERSALTAAARKLQDNVGWKIVSDATSGARIGLPSKLVPLIVSDVNGTKWSSATGTIQIEYARRKEAGATTATVAASEKKLNARKADYSVVKPDFFVLSGTQGLKKFYIRGQTRGDEVRVLTILYDQATEGTMIPVTVAMSSAYNPFPGNAIAQISPPPRKKVEYSTGIIASADGAIVADRQATDGCMTIAVPGYGNATRIADDETRELALLRIYGASGLKPLAMAGNGTTKSNVSITGISDPQNQGGHNAVTSVAAVAAPVGTDITLSPEPAVGFSGAAAIDSDGKFAGLTRLKPAVVAGPTGTPLPSQALLVSAESVREFLKAKGVAIASGASDAKASVLRLVCVRK
ncbi:MAG: peptidoglycan hydrolase-like protein with peptidoglycan-binding domain [Afipia broomeae]|jgi:peptidoglycan hydrolase-like protein with peptidoglycan-binding domain|nr:MAG: peptidoglycan-binding protein [Bradyrhizobiaceae bacterium]